MMVLIYLNTVILLKSSELLLNLINEEDVDNNKNIVIPIKLIKRKTT